LNPIAVAAMNASGVIAKYAFVSSTGNNKSADDPYAVCARVLHTYASVCETLVYK